MELKRHLSDFLEKLNKALYQPPLKIGFDLLESRLKIGRKYLAGGLVVFTLWLALGLLAPLVVNIIAFAYPSVQSIRALEQQDAQMAQKWLTYWIVYGLLSVSEFFIDVFLSWFPTYFLAKMIFLIWCMAPIELNGSDVIYNCAILPLFMQHKDKIEKLNENIHDLGIEANKIAKQASGLQKIEQRNFSSRQRGLFSSFKST